MASSQGTSVSSNSFSRWASHDIFLFKYHFLLHILRFLFFFSDSIMTDVASTQQTAALFLSTIVTRTRRHRNDKKRKKTDKPDWKLFQITNLMHNSFILQQYVCYTAILNMFRAAPWSSSGGQIVSPQPLVSSPSVNSRTVCRWRADWVRSPPAYCTAEQRAVRNMLRIVV